MRHLILLASVLAPLFVTGCQNTPTIPAPPPFTQYTNNEFDWNRVQRVLVMPLANRSQYPRVAESLQQALVTELQRTGRFETVAAPFDVQGPKAADVFATGRFDEVEVLNLSRRFQAQAIVFGRITQFHPYEPPRLGMSLMMVSPAEASVIASIDGMWDARDIPTRERGESYFDRTQTWPHSMFEKDLVRSSPRVFQRFVAYQVAKSIANTTMPHNSGSDIQFASHTIMASPHGDSSAIFVESDGAVISPTPVAPNCPVPTMHYPLGDQPVTPMGPVMAPLAKTPHPVPPMPAEKTLPPKPGN